MLKDSLEEVGKTDLSSLKSDKTQHWIHVALDFIGNIFITDRIAPVVICSFKYSASSLLRLGK